MNSLRNRVQLIGNLGMDPEVKTLENGNKLARVSVATNDYYVNAKGEKIVDTQWHNLVLWGKQADIAEKYLEKGHEVAVEGKLQHRSYEDKEGIKKNATEIVVQQFLMLRSGKA